VVISAPPFERIPEHGLVGDAFRSRIEGRRQLLQELFPPVRNETPAHRHQFRGVTIGELDDIDGVRRSDVAVGLQISSGARELTSSVVPPSPNFTTLTVSVEAML